MNMDLFINLFAFVILTALWLGFGVALLLKPELLNNGGH